MWKWSKAWEDWYRRVLPAYWIFLFLATHLPHPKLAGPGSDKRAHLLAFGMLAFLFWKFAESFHRPLTKRLVWIALPVLGVYAAADEYLQQFVKRDTNWPDLFANWAGIVIVLAALEFLRRRQAARASEA